MTDEKMVDKISGALTEKIGATVRDMGIEATMEKRFQQGAFVVIKVSVKSFDKEKLIRSAKG
jgi:hypothetical protein